MQIYIDTKYFALAIRRGRKNAEISRQDAARVFGLTTHDYAKIERGKAVPPTNMLERVMALGFTQLRTRHFNGAEKLKPLKPNKNDAVIFVSHRDAE